MTANTMTARARLVLFGAVSLADSPVLTPSRRTRPALDDGLQPPVTLSPDGDPIVIRLATEDLPVVTRLPIVLAEGFRRGARQARDVDGPV